MPSPAPSLCAQIASHAMHSPDRLAVMDGSTRLTFAELERQSNQLAAYLREAGAGTAWCIGLLLDRSAQFAAAALAVLKTGAAYLPLDPSTPAERTAFILADAGAPLLLTQHSKARDLLAGPWRVLSIDGPEAAAIATRPVTPAYAEPAPGSLAYVIYTSGSTGRPKGVEITHANLANLIAWHQAAFTVTAADRASQVAGLGFDAAVWETWPHLSAGASLHIADELTRRAPQALRDWLVAERITLSFVPTIMAEALLGMSWPAETALRVLLTGGDTLRRRPGTGLPFVVVNNYGPTECTVVATSGTVAPATDADGPPTLGLPIANAAALILDDALEPVLTGDVGELCLAGALVGRGYRNDPELTASRFVTYAPAAGPAMRVYRTGDRARLLANGEIAFLGRRDEQVKLRGYRIELGEIVACLAQYPGIEACTVIVRDAVVGADGASLELAAYVVPGREARLTVAGLREFLAARLPDYMIPAQYVALARLPVTVNGKLDKSALPAPAPDNLLPPRRADDVPAHAAATSSPHDSFQGQIAALVASLLGLASVEPEANFFMLGGHSMLAAQLVVRIRDLFGVQLTLRRLFMAPTVAALAAEVTRLRQQAG